MTKEGLKKKTVKGEGWSAVDNLASHFVIFVVSIVLARLISPEEYGLLGIITIFTSISQTIINGGFGSALVRKKGATEDDFNTVFISNMAISIALYIILFFSSTLISAFFDRQELTLLIRVTSITIILGGLSLTQRVQLTKRLDFKTQTIITLISSISSGIIGIVLALLGFGVWALVIQQISSSLFVTLCLWFFNRWIPKLYFSKQSFKELFGYGWKILLANLLSRVWKELYQLVVGKFFSPATLGQYTRGKQFAQFFSSNLTTVVQRVSFPALSEIQDDPKRMIAAYRKMIKVTMLVSTVAMFALGAISGPLLYCLIGPKWHEASTYLPYICISMSLYPLHAINLNMLAVQGRSDILLILEILKKIIGVAPLVVCIFVGIKAMLIVNIFTGIIAFFLNTYYTGRDLGYTSWMQIKDVIPSYRLATIIALSVYFLKYIPISNYIILPLQLILGSFVGYIICEKTKSDEYKEIKAIANSFVVKFRKK